MGRTILYLDPWSGVSGDMVLAALLDLDREDGRLEFETAPGHLVKCWLFK